MELAEITKGLNEILEKRKNKVKPNLETKMLYSKLWTELLKLQGFSRLAEEYFYKGFVYTGAGPLKEYLDSVKNKDILLNSIFKSRLFNQNVDSRFRIATGLLAEFINDEKCEFDILNILLMRYCHFAINKDGVIAESVPSSVFKYLILKMDLQKPLKRLEDTEIRLALLVELQDFFKEAFAKLPKKMSGNDKKKLERLKEWVGIKPEKQADGIMSTVDTQYSIEVPSELPAAVIPDTTDNVERIIKKYEEDKNALSLELKIWKNKNAESEKIVSNLRETVSQLKETNRFLNEKKVSLDNELAAITAKYNEVVSKLKDDERELESTKELLRIAQGMTQEEVDKKNVEMAGKLKPYYNAYKELDKQEMSVETGKMLKFILNDMLKVLARYDIKMQ